ncbi:MAG: D-cysteine desulfhydrase family protein [Elusimicrobia bacterium]|nr:D-cysteine desulfhydrase family protein [Elusimicrobiota bacterium]
MPSLKHRLPPRLALARQPTPIEKLEKFSTELGLSLWMKREDLTGSVCGGNKIRKLEFLLRDALLQKADTLITCGALQSNHARATAWAASKLGLRCHLFLEDSQGKKSLEGNLLLDRLLGAQVHTLSEQEYESVDQRMEQAAQAMLREGRRPYCIPKGGSNALGACGYIRVMEELLSQLGKKRLERTCLVLAVGSGGTYAGLALGKRILRLSTRIVGFNVDETPSFFLKKIVAISEEASRLLGIPLTLKSEEIEILDGYVGAGYGKSRPEELKLLARLASQEALLLDPTYTGKAFFGLWDQTRREPKKFGKEVLFLHTGGLFSLFAKGGELSPLLAS